VLAFPTEPAALKANAVVTAVAFKDSDARSAPTAAITMMKLETTLH